MTMESVNLLHADQHDINDDEEDEDEHPFLTRNYTKQSFTDSPAFKGCLLCIMTFIIAIFVGFIIASNISPQHLTQTLSLEFSTKSPTEPQPQHNEHINKNIHIQTPSPTTTTTSTTTTTTTSTTTSTTTTSTSTTQKPTNKPTTTTTSSQPTSRSTTTSTSSTSTTSTSKAPIPPQEAIAFASLHPLETQLENEELSKLETNFELIIVNEHSGMDVQRLKPAYGAVMIYYKYPNNPILTYATNEIRRTCFSFQLNQTSMFEHAMIDITFSRFELENGFDRVLIRHFNQSFIDLPLSYTGYQYNLSLQYVLESGSNKTICIELQSDQSITDHGIEYVVAVHYDLCQYSQNNECFTMQLWGKRWSRGPFMNGRCGLGIATKHRLNAVTDAQFTGNNLQGFLQNCAEMPQKHIQNEVEYCIKAKCEDIINEKGPQFDAAQVPGQGWYNISRYYNGAGRLDPNFADPFRIYLATENNLFQDLADVEWVNKLTNTLTAKAKEISDQHQHVNILKYAVLDPEHQSIAAEFIGAKVLDALINGKPFIVALTGDSVTSGHDNMFMSTYPMQLQSRLRKFFVDTGNVGATFLTRNFAVGGGPSSDSLGFMPVSMVTETFPGSFNKLSAILDDNYDVWYRNGGYPIRKLDLVTSEFFYVEGRGSYSSRELHLRESAYLGAVWAVINPVHGVNNVKDACKTWQELNETMMTDWMGWDKQRWRFMKHEYLHAMGIVAMDPNYGMPASCPLYKAGSEKLDANSHHEDDGLRPDGEMFAYTPWWLNVNWHPNSRGHRVMSDVISFWIINSAADFVNKYKDEIAGFNNMDDLNVFLKGKGGNWKENILKSVMDKKYDEWVTPEFCGMSNVIKDKTDAKQYNEYCASVPFALTNAKPMVYNTHNLLYEYVYDAEGTGTVWTEYIKHAGWMWQTSSSIVSIVRKKGAEGNMDTLWMLKPDANFFVHQFGEMYKNDDDNNKLTVLQRFDGFHKYLIQNRIYLQFVVKTPKYGSGRIKIFNGFNCNEYIQSIALMKVYVNKLEDMKGENGVSQLGEEITSSQCIITELLLDTKYVVSYVPYNITATSGGKGKAGFKEYYIMFLVAY